MSNQSIQLEDTKELGIIKPTDKNIQIFALYNRGSTVTQLAKHYGVTVRNIQAHIKRAKSFFGDQWSKYVLTDTQLEYDRVKKQWRNRIEQGSDVLIGKYYDKLVFPDRSASKPKSINFNLIARKIQVGTFKQQGQAIEAEAEIIDDK